MSEYLKIDLHTHTCYSKEPRVLGVNSRALYSPKRLIKQAIKRGLDGLAITDHDSIGGLAVAKAWLREAKISDFGLIAGEEISTSEGHLLAFGINEEIKKGMSPEESIDEIKRQGGISVAAHPFTLLGLKNRVYDLKLDGLEVVNPFSWLQFKTDRTHSECLKLGLTPTAGSDAHTLSIIGRTYTNVLSNGFSEEELLKGIKNRETTLVNNLGIGITTLTLLLNGLICFGSVRKDV